MVNELQKGFTSSHVNMVHKHNTKQASNNLCFSRLLQHSKIIIGISVHYIQAICKILYLKQLFWFNK